MKRLNDLRAKVVEILRQSPTPLSRQELEIQTRSPLIATLRSMRNEGYLTLVGLFKQARYQLKDPVNVRYKSPVRRDLTGMRFGRWLVLAQSTNFGKTTGWNCQCDCGTLKRVRASNLTGGGSVSCGCFQREIHRLPPAEAGFNLLLGRYQSNARSKKLPFELSREKFLDLVSQPCHYCGIPPLRKTPLKKGQSYPQFVYNGIDRKDSAIGYIVDNCVSCCFYCNRAKNNISYADFNLWLDRIAQHRKN